MGCRSIAHAQIHKIKHILNIKRYKTVQLFQYLQYKMTSEFTLNELKSLFGEKWFYILYITPVFRQWPPVFTLKCYCFMIITFIDKYDHLKKVYLSSGAIFTQLKMIIKLYVQFKSEIGREIGSLTPVFLTAIYRKLHHFRNRILILWNSILHRQKKLFTL